MEKRIRDAEILLDITFMSVKEIAVYCGISVSAVCQLIKENGIKRPTMYRYSRFIDQVLSFVWYDAIISLYDRGYTPLSAKRKTGANIAILKAIYRAWQIDNNKSSEEVDRRIRSDEMQDFLKKGVYVYQIARQKKISCQDVKIEIFDHLYRNRRAYKKCVLHPDESVLSSSKVEEIKSLDRHGVPRVLIASRLNINLRSVFRALEGDSYFERFEKCR